LAIYRVTRQIDFCYGHRLLNYDGKCKFLHGHNGRAIVTIESDELDDRGMVMDFTDIKRDVAGWIDSNLDHRMILNGDDPVVAVLRELGEPMYLIDGNPTAEAIARLIYEFAADKGYPVKQVDLWETPRCFATYRADEKKGPRQ
jgi:6-pyruvoyltetrahydropterin/6-carboxytetrahydropterin synthase